MSSQCRAADTGRANFELVADLPLGPPKRAAPIAPLFVAACPPGRAAEPPVVDRTFISSPSLAPAPLKVAGAIEGEEMKVLSTTGGSAARQEMDSYHEQWSNDAQLWWTKGKVGDKLELALPVSAAGRDKLILQLTKARDYGIVRISLDDKPLFDTVDLYDPEVVHAKLLTTEPLDLPAGQRRLQFEITVQIPRPSGRTWSASTM